MSKKEFPLNLLEIDDSDLDDKKDFGIVQNYKEDLNGKISFNVKKNSETMFISLKKNKEKRDNVKPYFKKRKYEILREIKSDKNRVLSSKSNSNTDEIVLYTFYTLVDSLNQLLLSYGLNTNISTKSLKNLKIIITKLRDSILTGDLEKINQPIEELKIELNLINNELNKFNLSQNIFFKNLIVIVDYYINIYNELLKQKNDYYKNYFK